jgi:very-short-patch-repair endonuclease
MEMNGRDEKGRFTKGHTLNKNCEFTPLHRLHLSLAMKGKRKGIKPSEFCYERLREYNRLHKKGQLPWWEKKNLPHPMKNSETSRKVAEKLKGRIPWNKGKKLEEWMSYEGIQKNRLWHLGRKRSLESIRKQSETLANKWKDPEYRKTIIKASLKGLFKRPTSLERRFMEVFKKHSLPIVYCGNGEIIIGGYNPDFYINGKKICIEVANRYFHNKQWEVRRIKHFNKYGWKCIVLWEEELSSEELLTLKLRKY